ncbi:hypothetical protein RSAG8_11929, partial [Rhizoctonia solani AG-8 WAC10335]
MITCDACFYHSRGQKV